MQHIRACTRRAHAEQVQRGVQRGVQRAAHQASQPPPLLGVVAHPPPAARQAEAAPQHERAPRRALRPAPPRRLRSGLGLGLGLGFGLGLGLGLGLELG